jgi:hypothetical protein
MRSIRNRFSGMHFNRRSLAGDLWKIRLRSTGRNVRYVPKAVRQKSSPWLLANFCYHNRVWTRPLTRYAVKAPRVGTAGIRAGNPKNIDQRITQNNFQSHNFTVPRSSRRLYHTSFTDQFMRSRGGRTTPASVPRFACQSQWGNVGGIV